MRSGTNRLESLGAGSWKQRPKERIIIANELVGKPASLSSVKPLGQELRTRPHTKSAGSQVAVRRTQKNTFAPLAVIRNSDSPDHRSSLTHTRHQTDASLQLQHDLVAAFESRLFADLILDLGANHLIHCHAAIFNSRVPSLLPALFSSRKCNRANSPVTVIEIACREEKERTAIHRFVQHLYTGKDIPSDLSSSIANLLIMSRPSSGRGKSPHHMSLDEQVMNESWTEAGNVRASGMVRSSTFDVLCRDDGDKVALTSNHSNDSSLIQSSGPTPTKSSRSQKQQKSQSAKVRKKTATLPVQDDDAKPAVSNAASIKSGQQPHSKQSAAETSLFQFFVGMEKSSPAFAINPALCDHAKPSDSDARLPVGAERISSASKSDSRSQSRSGLIFYDMSDTKSKTCAEDEEEEAEEEKRKKLPPKQMVETDEQVIVIVTEDRLEKCKKALSAKDESDEEDECATPVNAGTTSSRNPSAASHRNSQNKRSSHRLSSASSSIMSCSWTESTPRSLSQTSLRRSQQRNQSPSSFDCDSEMSMSMSSSVIASSVKRSSSRVRCGQEEDRLTRQLRASNKLGDDLLRMLLKEIDTDVEISAQGRIIKAHRFILCCRSSYFRSILKVNNICHNNGPEQQEKKFMIQMNGFTFQIVHFALCHMYSGSIILPKDPSLIPDLALISDLLQLDSLTQTIVHELTMSYCHSFHKPCKDCSIGVLDCLILADACQLLDLKGKCLDWLGKHFTRLWPTKAFASLTKELMNECYINTVTQLTAENVIDTILACERLSSSLPRIKWAETIFNLITKLQKDSSAYITNHYDVIVENKSFTGLSRGRDWNIHAIEETFILAISDIDPDTALRSLTHLSKYAELATNTETGFGHGPYSEAFVSLVKKLIKYTERQIVHFGTRATSSSAWDSLPLQVQNRIHDSALIVYEFDKPIKPLRIVSIKDGEEKVANRLVKSIASAHKTSRPSSAGHSRNDESAPALPPHSSKMAAVIADHKTNTKSPAHRRKSEKVLLKSDANATATASPPPAMPAACPPHSESSVNHSEPIYCEVPCENNETKIAAHTLSSKIPGPAAPPAAASKKSQVAKVSPFNLKTNLRDISKSDPHSDVMGSSVTSKADLGQDLMAEIDADSNLVHHCLQEAEALEAELTRKLKHYQANFCKDLPSRQSAGSRRKGSLPAEVRNPIPAFIGPNVPRTRTGLVPTSPRSVRKSAGSAAAAKPASRTGNRTPFK